VLGNLRIARRFGDRPLDLGFVQMVAGKEKAGKEKESRTFLTPFRRFRRKEQPNRSHDGSQENGRNKTDAVSLFDCNSING
jgi:hypothetical protein